MNSQTTLAPPTSTDRLRLTGLDAARGIAFAGMLVAHYAHSTSRDDPGWLQAVHNVADGRAAPLFCVLLGLGCGLYLRNRTPGALARRGLVLLALGLLIWPFVERVYLILPQYGVLILLATLSSRIPTRWLLPLAAGSWLVPSLAVATIDGHGLRAAVQPDTYVKLLDLPAISWQLLWSGGYPLVGWVGFLLVGLWLSRLRLGDRAVQLRLLSLGVAVAVLQPLAALVPESLGGVEGVGTRARGPATFFDSTAHSNQTAWYLVATGSAVAVIAVCLLVSRPTPAAFTVLGRSALSAYLLHLLVGAVVVWPWRDDAKPTLAAQLFVAGLVLLSLIGAATVWSRRFGRAPVEALVRRVSP